MLFKLVSFDWLRICFKNMAKSLGQNLWPKTAKKSMFWENVSVRWFTFKP